MDLPGSLSVSGIGGPLGVCSAPALTGCILGLWVGEGDKATPLVPWGYAAASRPRKMIARNLKAVGLIVCNLFAIVGRALEIV